MSKLENFQIECAEVASLVNQDNSGMVIDEVTTLINTVCIFENLFIITKFLNT